MNIRELIDFLLQYNPEAMLNVEANGILYNIERGVVDLKEKAIVLLTTVKE